MPRPRSGWRNAGSRPATVRARSRRGCGGRPRRGPCWCPSLPTTETAPGICSSRAAESTAQLNGRSARANSSSHQATSGFDTDREGARTVARDHVLGWALLCNGVVLFDVRPISMDSGACELAVCETDMSMSGGGFVSSRSDGNRWPRSSGQLAWARGEWCR
ncbi:DUF5999 family protein [Streptomyces sp. NPDC055681]